MAAKRRLMSKILLLACKLLLDDRDNDYDDEEDDINLDIDILMLVRE
jgi:hypothetical protein